ncbi:protein GUCD1-like [Pollicipes pollicipes]|uniref:protein GUCD1-like n=1 Tax=Pollicipes pollicipes TaxID=41117 RepID=UPI0018857164|nr:protein GUCD1-like [Pollicipes pollicipes]
MPRTGPAPQSVQVPEDLPERAQRPQVVSVQQRHRWDCGLACIMMVLPEAKRNHFIENFQSVCHDEGFGKSTWTIDLVYLLHRFGVRQLYCTLTLGIDPGYRRQSFYGYGRVLRMDAARVTERFAKAASLGVPVERRAVPVDEVLHHLATSGPVVVLTDGRYLRCDRCHTNQAGSELTTCFPCISEYKGHYIVLYGYDLSKRVVFYRNPTFRDRECCMSVAALDQCRRSYGTDEDIIFVFDSWTS